MAPPLSVLRDTVAATRSAPATMTALPSVVPPSASSAAFTAVEMVTLVSETPTASPPTATPRMLVFNCGVKVASTSTWPMV